MPIWVIKVLSGARKVPWAKVLAVIAWLNTEGRKYWRRLTPGERREILDLAVKSKGSRSNLTGAELGRVLDLFAKIKKDVAAQ